MKQRNRYRSERRGQNIRLLEKALSLRDRLFSVLALRRGLRRLRYWAFILVALAIVVTAAVYFTPEAANTARNASMVDKVSYSTTGSISKEQVLDMLDFKAVNIAQLNVREIKEKLESNLCIAEATVEGQWPDTLSIEIVERIPVVYVEMASAASTGEHKQLFMCPDGVLFPVVAEYHQNYLDAPTWYLNPDDISEIKPGAVISKPKRSPILELVKASNSYDLPALPHIREIFRPKPWKINLTLDEGIVVEMQVYRIREQMERLVAILEHARVSKRHPSSINVIPRLNPTVTYRSESEAQKAKQEAGTQRSGRRRR